MPAYWKTMVWRLAANVAVAAIPAVVLWLQDLQKSKEAGMFALVAGLLVVALKQWQSSEDAKAPAK